MTTGKIIALTRWILVGKVMSLLFNMLFRLVTTFLSRSKRLLISWLQSPSAVILGIANKAEVDVFLELSCFFHDPEDVGNLISGSSAFSKTSLDFSCGHVWM